MASPDDQVVVMRSPCLMEDEGRHTFVMTCCRAIAEAWIRKQEDEYFKPSDYYIAEQQGPLTRKREVCPTCDGLGYIETDENDVLIPPVLEPSTLDSDPLEYQYREPPKPPPAVDLRTTGPKHVLAPPPLPPGHMRVTVPNLGSAVVPYVPCENHEPSGSQDASGADILVYCGLPKGHPGSCEFTRAV